MNRKLKIPKMYNFRKEKEDNYKKYLSVPEWFLKLGCTPPSNLGNTMKF
jgi:hypothetical protein